MENTNQINKASWDAYQEDYFTFHLLDRPDYFAFYSGGGVSLSPKLLECVGDVRGKKLLDTCCACDAQQAFSWHNLGARVTACDITPKAIEIASRSSTRMGLDVRFVEADMQTLTPFAEGEFDIVYATYVVWLKDLKEACRNWLRVLKPGGRLLLHTEHPVRYAVGKNESGLFIQRSYNKPGADRMETFEGTPLADLHGGWSKNLPSVENVYRISDILNAVCDAGFVIRKTLEDYDLSEDQEIPYGGKPPLLRDLPTEFIVVADKSAGNK